MIKDMLPASLQNQVINKNC